MIIIKMLRKILGYCSGCQRYFVYPKKRRMSTQYNDEESNYITSCIYCYEEVELYWAERWEEYYRGRL